MLVSNEGVASVLLTKIDKSSLLFREFINPLPGAATLRDVNYDPAALYSLSFGSRAFRNTNHRQFSVCVVNFLYEAVPANRDTCNLNVSHYTRGHSYALPEHLGFDRVICVCFPSRVLHASSITITFCVVKL